MHAYTYLYPYMCEYDMNVEMRLTILATEERELCVVCAKDAAAHPGEVVHVNLVVAPGVLQEHHALWQQVIYRHTVRFPARFRIRITKSFIAIRIRTENIFFWYVATVSTECTKNIRTKYN